LALRLFLLLPPQIGVLQQHAPALGLVLGIVGRHHSTS
jgi:hypothetical protein